MAKKDRKAKKKSDSGRKKARKAAPEIDFPSVPTWLPVVLFGALTVVLFREFIFSNQMLVGQDTLGLGYVARAFYADALTRLGDFPAWAPQILGGTPFIEALSAGDSLYPPSALLLLFMEPHRALGWKLVIHVLAAGFFMFGWVRAIGVSRAGALLAGVGYMLAPYFVTLVYPGHDGKIFVTALAPLLFWAVERHFVRPSVRSFASIALVVALVIFTTHFQMAYFLFLATGAFAAFRAWEVWKAGQGEAGAGEAAGEDGAVSGGVADAESGGVSPNPTPAGRGASAAGLRFAVFLAASIAGAGVAGVQLIPAFDYVTQDSRRVQTTREAEGETSKDWAAQWSLHPEEAMSLAVPEFVGGNIGGTGGWTENTYWGRNGFKLNHEYIGLVLLILAAVSFVGGARAGLRWFLLGLAGLSVLMALGANTPVWHVAYAVVPGVDLFRAMSQVVYLAGFGATTLAALGFDRIIEVVRDGDEAASARVQKVLWGAAGVMGLFFLLAASGALTGLWTSIVYSGIIPAREQALQLLMPHMVRGAGVAMVFAGITAGLVWALRSHYLAPTGLLAGLVLLVAVDQIRVDARYIHVMDFDAWAAPDSHIQTILGREAASEEPFRYLSFVQGGQNVDPAMHGLELAAGHHPNDLNRYRELIGMIGSGVPENLYTPQIQRLLNVKYLLWPDYAYEVPTPPFGQVINQLQFQDGRIHSSLMEVAGLPRARLVGSAVVRPDGESVPYMMSPDFDPEREVVLPEAPPVELPGGEPVGAVEWIERGPDRMTLSVSTDRPALLVVADNWYPAWKATVGGDEAPVLRAYHTLRAVPIPAGEHEVEMYYESETVQKSLWLSLALFLAILAALGVDFARSRGGREAN